MSFCTNIMKVTLYTNNNHQSNNNKIPFKSGMTPQIMKQIQNCDVTEISKKLADKDIITDFNGNKVVAWCCDKIVDIFGQIKKKSGVNLALPKEIHVENFDNLKVYKKALGFCTVFASEVYLNKDDISQGRSIFFNSLESEKAQAPENLKKYYDWNNINELSDVCFFNRNASSSHFLYNIMHEFSHSAHENNLEKNIGEDYPYFIYSHNNEEYIEEFNARYKELAQKTCDYAGTNPFETIACDMPRQILNSLNADLNITKNPFKNSPYEKQTFVKKLFSPEINDEYFNMIKDFWNGNF